jgi:Protein of unknown function (DUF2690)
MPQFLRTRRARRLAVAGTLAALAFSLLAAVLPQSASAATCYGTGCQNRDPQLTGCSAGAYTLNSATIYEPLVHDEGFGDYAAVGRVDLRFSPTCGTKWARITTYVTDGFGNPFHVYVEARYMATGTRYIEYGYYYVAWTNMMFAPQLGSPGQRVCVWGMINIYGSSYQSAQVCG